MRQRSVRGRRARPGAAAALPWLLIGVLLQVLALAPPQAHAQASVPRLPQPAAERPVDDGDDDGDVVLLPGIIVRPPAEDLRTWGDRDMRRLQGSLPGLGTELQRSTDFADKLREGLGLAGDGVLGLHPSDQQRLRSLLDKLDGVER
jgi:hypothetical protein